MQKYVYSEELYKLINNEVINENKNKLINYQGCLPGIIREPILCQERRNVEEKFNRKLIKWRARRKLHINLYGSVDNVFFDYANLIELTTFLIRSNGEFNNIINDWDKFDNYIEDFEKKYNVDIFDIIGTMP